jgi:hypothetical protein
LQANDVVTELTHGRTMSNEYHRLVVTELKETAEEFVFGAFIER